MIGLSQIISSKITIVRLFILGANQKIHKPQFSILSIILSNIW